MVDHKAFKVVKQESVPKGSMVLTSTWNMKQKADGTYRERLTTQGYEQREGQHYQANKISLPVVHKALIAILLILICMGRLYAEVNDVEGAFYMESSRTAKKYT